MAELRYHVFISYARADEAWARRLAQDLTAKQLTPFLDVERLQDGAAWGPQLMAALQDSQHLVALWSERAKASNWVTQELYRFRQIVDPDAVGLLAGRRIFPVLMDSTADPAPDIQSFRALREARVYPGEPEDAGAVWNTLVDRIADAIRGDDNSVPIPLLVVTTTRDRVDEIDDARVPPAGPSLAELIQELGIGPKEKLRESYDDSRLDWRPFGSNATVRVILDGLRDELNRELAAWTPPDGEVTRFRWDYVDDEFWSGPDGADAVTRRLRAGPAVIVVDPLSFYDELVADRYTNYLLEILSNADAFVLVLSPFAIPSAVVALREALRARARRVFTHYYEPPAFAGQAYARSSGSVGDEVEFRGWVTTALAGHLTATRSRSNPYLDAST